MIHYYANQSPEVTASEQAHSDHIRRIAGECMVLLENDGVLPLSGPQKVALFGNGARATVKGGTGSGEVNSRFSVSVEQGLEAAGFTVTSKQWLAEQDRVIQEEFGTYMADVHERASAMGIPDFFVMFNEHFIPKALAPFQMAEGDLAIYVIRVAASAFSQLHTQRYHLTSLIYEFAKPFMESNCLLRIPLVRGAFRPSNNIFSMNFQKTLDLPPAGRCILPVHRNRKRRERKQNLC